MKIFLYWIIVVTLSSNGYCQTNVRPNILWIIAEDMSQDLGCYGNSIVHTPTIDSLSYHGMKFTNMFATAGVCAPSRTSIATGMYQTSLGAMHMRYSEILMPELPKGVRTIEYIMVENGYQTLGIGKDDYSFKLDSCSFDFNKIVDLEQGKPFFAKVSSSFTHRDFKDDLKNPIDQDSVQLLPYYPDASPIREDWAAYLENVQLLDNEVKEILANFEKLGFLENTVIFFFSDHGRPFLKGKYWTYDSGIQIPFIVSFTKDLEPPENFKPGASTDQMLSTIDISATTLALAGIKRPEYMQGRIFLGEESEPERQYIFSSIDRISGSHFKTRAVRSKKYKYIKNFNNGRSVLECTTEYAKAKYPDYSVIRILDNYNKLIGAQKTLVTPLPPEELYDIENDPFEINNLAYNAEFLGVRTKMETVLMEWIRKTSDKGFLPESPEIQKHFTDFRTKSKKRFAEERLNIYLQVRNKLKEKYPF